MLLVGSVLGRTEKILNSNYFSVFYGSNEDPQLRRTSGWECRVVGERFIPLYTRKGSVG